MTKPTKQRISGNSEARKSLQVAAPASTQAHPVRTHGVPTDCPTCHGSGRTPLQFIGHDGRGASFPCDHGAPAIRKGDLVRFKPEWLDAGDTYQYVATSDSSKGRVDVTATGPDCGPFTPINTVRLDMLEGF